MSFLGKNIIVKQRKQFTILVFELKAILVKQYYSTFSCISKMPSTILIITLHQHASRHLMKWLLIMPKSSFLCSNNIHYRPIYLSSSFFYSPIFLSIHSNLFLTAFSPSFTHPIPSPPSTLFFTNSFTASFIPFFTPPNLKGWERRVEEGNLSWISRSSRHCSDFRGIFFCDRIESTGTCVRACVCA